MISKIINSYAWIIFVLAQSFIISYLSFRANKTQSNNILIAMWFIGVIPLWTFICKYSNDIVLAGYLYDFVYAFGWTMGVIICQDKAFGISQWLGIGLMIVGIFLVKR